MSRLQQTQVVPDALVLSTVKVNGYNIDGNCQAWQPYQAPVSRTPPGIEQMGTPVKGACLPMTEEGLIEGAESIKGEKVRTDMDTNIDNVIKPVAGDVGQWKMGLHFGGGAQGEQFSLPFGLASLTLGRYGVQRGARRRGASSLPQGPQQDSSLPRSAGGRRGRVRGQIRGADCDPTGFVSPSGDRCW